MKKRWLVGAFDFCDYLIYTDSTNAELTIIQVSVSSVLRALH